MLDGDERAFDEFFDAYFPGLYRFALARLDRNADLAEDVVQAAMAKAVSKISTYRGEAALFTWLCTFCRREMSAHFARHGRHPMEAWPLEETPEIRAALESLTSSDGDAPDERLRQRELARLVQVALDGLPRHYADALEWKYMQGLTVVEIAERLHLGPKATESLLTRARDAFRDGFASLAAGAEAWQR